MNQEQNLIKRVLIAQHNIDEADSLIRDYFPFIKSETAKTLGRIPVEGKDDELSIAMMGFHEAIESYESEKGTFLNFASVVIKRRIVDFLRQESKFRNHVSWEEMSLDEEMADTRKVADEESIVDRETLKWEIMQLTGELQRIGITISEIAASCPKYEKAVSGCRQAVQFLIDRPEQMTVLFETGKLPVQKIIEATKVRKKTLEKYRKYIIALAVIYFRGYNCMTDHLAEVFKSQKGGK